MTKALYALSLLTVVLGGVALALWLMPAPDLPHEYASRRYGVHEGLQLAYMADGHGGGHFAVEDASGRLLYDIPLRGCVLDVRFRDGRLRFRENSTGREGYIDRSGTVTFLPTDGHTPQPQEHKGMANQATAANNAATTTAADGKPAEGDRRKADAADLRRMARSDPFYAEASKILSGKLSVEDADRRRTIIGYCEHLRTAYTTKDIDFLRQVPTTWDETRYIDGYPGRYVVLARRHADTWYIAAINATGKPLQVEVAEPLKAGARIAVYTDGKKLETMLKKQAVTKNGKLRLTVQPQGGAVVVMPND